MAATRISIMLCLIRCGETSWQETGRLVGATDLPLAPAGRAAVSEAMHRLTGVHAASIYHPADEAAADTARLCAGSLRARPRRVEALADPRLGLLEGLTAQEFEERYPSRHRQWEDDPLGLVPPEGEPLADAADRIFRAVAKVLKRARGEETAIVLHDLALGMLRCWLSERPLTQMHVLAARRPRLERYAIPLPMLDELARGVEAMQTSE